MADLSKRGPDCDDCDGEGGERGERGKRGKRGHRGHDGKDGHDGRDGRDGDVGATGPTGPATSGGGPIVTDPTPPTLTGNGTEESPLQVINVAPQPYTFPYEFRIIYVRATGDDDEGDGTTIATAFRTVQRAALEVPMFIPGGVFYYIDCTDLLDGGPELFPPQYRFPPWKAPQAFSNLGGEGPMSEFFLVQTAVNITAAPRNVPALGADALVDGADLAPTIVGGDIIGATNTGPIEITTTTPHGLWAAPFPAQQVTIAGVNGNTAANGTWFVFVTSPTTFILDGSTGNGAFAPSPGSTVTTPFVQDPISGQVQIKVSLPRWVPGSLTGKMFLDPAGVFGHAVIYDNTADTLYLAIAFAPTIGVGSPGRIVEPSAEFNTQPLTEGGYVGGLNFNNIDSCSINGIRVVPTVPGERTLRQYGGTLWVQGCQLENPTFINPARQANSIFSDMVNPSYEAPIYQARGLFRDQTDDEAQFAHNWQFAFDGTVFKNYNEILSSDDGGVTGFFAVKVIDSLADAAYVFNHGLNTLDFCSIEGGAGDAIRVLGQGRHVLTSVGGSGWAGVALRVDNGGQVQVDAATFTAPGDTMVVGTLPPRTFANFRFMPPDGGEFLNQFDITGFNPNPPVFGAKGTGSRVFQK